MGAIARLATHIDIAGVAAKRRWTLIREAALLNWRVSTTGGAALRVRPETSGRIA